MAQDQETRDEESVRVTLEQEGAKDEAQELFEKRVDRVRKKLDENSAHRALFITEPFGYLAREGLLQDADEVRFSMDDGGFEDLALVQSIATREPGFGTQRTPRCIWTTVCVTIQWGPVTVQICVQKHF